MDDTRTTKIRGVAIAPGVSRNGRYYSPAMIAGAVAEAQPRVRAGQMLMKSHHDAADTLGYVGRVTSLQVAEDGSATFEGELADTSTARDVSALIRGSRPFISGVSIAGTWTGQPQRVKVGEQSCETSSGLVLHSVDFTASPGIEAARIVAESAPGTRVIRESATAAAVTEDAEMDALVARAMQLVAARKPNSPAFANLPADVATPSAPRPGSSVGLQGAGTAVMPDMACMSSQELQRATLSAFGSYAQLTRRI